MRWAMLPPLDSDAAVERAPDSLAMTTRGRCPMERQAQATASRATRRRLSGLVQSD
jgi:hypothetical protein